MAAPWPGGLCSGPAAACALASVRVPAALGPADAKAFKDLDGLPSLAYLASNTTHSKRGLFEHQLPGSCCAGCWREPRPV